jgi:peptide-methionine (S)-S-oxide reductase
MGCFWKPSEELLKVQGVVDTVVGYTGNPQDSDGTAPSYESVCLSRRWVEGVRVIYDDETISYRQLLDAFFEAQEPKYGSRQYASIIFAHDAEQEKAAQDWLASNDIVRKDGVSSAMTKIEALAPFFRAEAYHQRYWQKTRPRLALLVVLLAFSSRAFDSIVPLGFQTTLYTFANALSIALMLYVGVERVFDREVIKL